MALLFYDGFDYYSASEAIARGWSNVIDAMSSGRFAPGQAAEFTGAAAVSITHTLPSTYTTIIAGFALNISYGGTGANQCFAFNNSGSEICALNVNQSTGKLQVWHGAQGTTLVATGTTTINSGSWYYVELKIFINGASSTVEVHLNGVVEIASTTVNLGSTPTNQIYIGRPNNNPVLQYDDLYILDTTGGSPTNTFLGDSRIETLYPSGAGAHTQWTPDSGSNYARVNETIADGDTSFVQDSNAGDRDSYAFTNLSVLAGTVYAVQTSMYARKDDVAVRQLCAVARPGSTDRDGATVTLGTSYAFFNEIRETNPDTTAAWLISEVNASEFGIKLVT